MKSVATARGDVNAQRSLAMGVPRNSCYSGDSANGVDTYTRGNGSGTSRQTMRNRRLLGSDWTMCGDFRTRISSPIGLDEEPLHLQLVRNGDRSLHLLLTRDHRIARD